MFSKIIAVSALVALTSAQSASTTVSQSMPPAATSGFNPGNVSASDASSWCLAQQNTCPQICGSTVGGYASTNACSSTAFTYTCICANGTEPDVTAYVQTLPYFICQATYMQCVDLHPNDLTGQANCKTDEQCGTLNATALEASASGAAHSSASSTAAASSSTSSSGSATSAAGSAASATPTGAAAMGQQMATGTFAAVLWAAFKFLL